MIWKFALLLGLGIINLSCSTRAEISKLSNPQANKKLWNFPLHPNQAIYSIEVYLQGLGKKTFVVDTGSNLSFLIQESRIPSKPVFKKSLSLNQFLLENVPFYQLQAGLSEDDNIGTFLIPVVDFLPDKEGWDGILGNDILSNYIVDFEFPSKITFHESSLEEKDNSKYTWFPLEEKMGHYFLNISGKKFLLDTGAGISVLPEEIPHTDTLENVNLVSLGKESQSKAKIKKTQKPFCLNQNMFCIPDFKFVVERVSSSKTLTGKKENSNDGILGQNWFESHSIRIDYGNRRLGISNNHVQRQDHSSNEWGSR